MKALSNIHLEKMLEEDIELVRNWRNKEYVRNQLLSQNTISEDDQRRWFTNVQANEEEEKYFLALDGDFKFGLFYLKAITSDSAETGAFVGEEKYLSTHKPITAAFLLMCYCFDELKLKQLTACHFKTNKRASRSDAFLGYITTKEEDGVVYNKITKEEFQKKREIIVKTFEVIK